MKKGAPNKPNKSNNPNKPRSTWLKPTLQVIGFLLLTAAALIAAQFIVGITMYLILKQQFTQPVWSTIYAAITYILAFIIIMLPLGFQFKQRKTETKTTTHTEKRITWSFPPKTFTREKLGLKGLPTWTDLGLAPIGFIVYFILAAIFIGLFSLLPWFDALEAQDVGFNNLYTHLDRLVAFIALVVIAPFFEELIFRGWLYDQLREKISFTKFKKLAAVLAIFLVSLLFGVLHGQWNVGINVFALSIILCLLREITGTIYAGILLHALKNALAFFLLFVVGFN